MRMPKINLRALPKKLLMMVVHLPKNIWKAMVNVYSHTISFIIILIAYMITSTFSNIIMSKWIPLPFTWKSKISILVNGVYYLVLKISRYSENTINRTNLIQLALNNMKFKKSRTFITIGGMAIGIGAIVFLVSIGYGLQNLVISRVASLNEMQQATISPPVGGDALINDATLARIGEIQGVESVLPQIDAVGKVSIGGSVSDMVVYGVTSEYLRQSALKPVAGKIFESDELSLVLPDEQNGTVAGAFTATKFAKYQQPFAEVDFQVHPDTWVMVHEEPNSKSRVLGYTKRGDGVNFGVAYWGAKYYGNLLAEGVDEQGTVYHTWIRAKLPLWERENCDVDEQPECLEGTYLPIVESESQIQRRVKGFVAHKNMESQFVLSKSSGEVLGSTTEEAGERNRAADEVLDVDVNDWIGEVLQENTDDGAAGTTDATGANNGVLEEIELDELASEAAESEETAQVELGEKAVRQMIVNTEALKILGLTQEEAVGKKIDLSIAITGDLLDDGEETLQSVPAEYEIVGVIPDGRSQVLYVPFIDIRSLGVTQYSQVKMVAKNQEVLEDARTAVENIGFATSSVADTVAQINNLFDTIRTVLFLIGMAALAVASLGMFNTLTVSLLERTREVGLMKAMGMRSNEVHELFLTESMIMGIFGGLAGLVIGFAGGQLASLGLTFFALSSGEGYLNISFIPPTFIIIIMVLSLIVGLITGLYPARHATKISALNALRYE
jgi:ABC-type antimicrobial peptide transport system permease subunit